ncbi:amidohydrolase family protein [Nisaea sp.]|uniref:amidohydrolase family protein n=1 Tax=Nisaea sp. TaxID=2024842 RepID=UPI00326598F8
MAASASFAQGYDLVIKGGRVMDPETMFDDVGISDGRIVAISKAPLEGEETIDAKGLVVAPGFIDTHYHPVDEFATMMALRDGVTTGMDLEFRAFNVGGWYEVKAETGWQVSYGTTTGQIMLT